MADDRWMYMAAAVAIVYITPALIERHVVRQLLAMLPRHVSLSNLAIAVMFGLAVVGEHSAAFPKMKLPVGVMDQRLCLLSQQGGICIYCPIGCPEGQATARVVC